MRSRATCVGPTSLYASLAALAMGCAISAPAKDAPEPKPAERPTVDATQSLDEFKRSAKLYDIVLASDPSKSLILREEPVLRWTRLKSKGALFVWTANGRPEVVASFDQNLAKHELQSLAATGLTATRGGETVWAPKHAGVEFIPIPGAPRPATTSAERLDQMRALAREFYTTCTVTDDPDPLTLLPKTLYRYDIG
jgi:hypothetical protein